MTNFFDYFWLALKNLSRSRLRSLLTMIGIFVGIAAVISLVSLSQGLKDSIQIQFDKIGADKIFVSIKNTNLGMLADLSSSRLTLEDIDEMRKVRGVELVAPTLFKSIRVSSGRDEGSFYAISLPDDNEERKLAIDINSIEVVEGKMPAKGDRYDVLVGADLIKEGLFSKRIQLGTKILVNGQEFRVGGIMKKVGDPGTDNGVFMSEKTMRDLLGEPELVSYVMVKSAAGEDPLAVADSLTRRLRSFRGLEKGNEDFEVQTPDDILRTLNTILNIIQVVLVGVSIISLIVGGIGIMNTMYTAVLERTVEIGVLKAVGARNSDVLMLFTVEAGFLGLVGGAVGIALGAAIAEGIRIGATIALGTDYLVIYFPWELIVGTLAFSFLIGAVSGVVPAWQASKLPPVEALRYE